MDLLLGLCSGECPSEGTGEGTGVVPTYFTEEPRKFYKTRIKREWRNLTLIGVRNNGVLPF